jgi:hypothetical protein
LLGRVVSFPGRKFERGNQRERRGKESQMSEGWAKGKAAKEREGNEEGDIPAMKL